MAILFALTSCMKGEAFVDFPEGLKGGIYALSPTGTKMTMYDGSTSYLVDTSNSINLSEINAIIIRKEGG